jgi:putative DNA primase/helicase
MGAGKWKSIYDRYFGGRDVIIIPDNDEPGRNHAKQVARSLKGIARSVRIAELPDLPEKGDVSDFLLPLTDATKEDFLNLICLPELERKDESRTDDYHFISGNVLLAMPKPEVEWIWDGILGAGHLGLVMGKPKAGKTYFTFNLAVAVSRGTAFLGREVTQGPVLYLALDQDEIQKYMDMMGGDFSNIKFHCDKAPTDAVDKLIKEIEERSPRLVIADIMQKLVRLKDEKSYSEAITKLEPLSDVARRRRCGIILNHHSPKQEREIVDSALGTTGLVASADTSILIKKDQNDRRSLYTLQRYHNLGEQDIKGEVIDLLPDGITLKSNGTIFDVNTREGKDQILEFLSSTEEAVAVSEIVKEIKRDKAFTLKCLRELNQEFKIRISGSGRRSDPFKYSFRHERNI